MDLGVGSDYKTILVLDDQEEIGDIRDDIAGVEVVLVSADTKVIRAGAFADLKNLRRVVFQPGSRLERIERGSFRNCGLERIMLPKHLV